MASFLPAKDAAMLAWAVNFKTLIGAKGTECAYELNGIATIF